MKLFLVLGLRRLKELGVFLFNASQWISALITIFATSIGVAIITWTIDKKEFVVPLIAFASGMIFTGIVAVYVYLKASPTKWVLRGYRWIFAEYIYRINEDDHRRHSQTIRVMLESVRRGVDFFENRYQWSGKGKEDDPQILSPGHRLLGTPVQLRLYKYYYVHLGRELRKGERTEVKILQNLYDSDNKFEPFLAKTIVEPLDTLSLRVVFPKNREPVTWSCTEQSAAIPAGSVLRELKCNYNTETWELSCEIQSPVFGYRYELRWGW